MECMACIILFLGTHKIITLHYSLYGKNILSVCYNTSNIMKLLSISNEHCNMLILDYNIFFSSLGTHKKKFGNDLEAF